MLLTNPFGILSASISSIIMQAYVAIMAAFVVAGTLYDMSHKRSAAYFFKNWNKLKRNSTRQVSGGEMASLAMQTAFVDVLSSAEFCNTRRRIAHLLTMYGFFLYVITTVVMVFGFSTPTTPTPAILPGLWYIGALMICLGGYWFWFTIRADVAAEGNSPFRITRADLFILSLVSSATFGLIWACLQAAGSIWAIWLLGLYVVATTVLFGSVPWSKFSHMFYKPAAAFQRRVEDANGARRNLPLPADRPSILGSTRQRPQTY